MRAVDDDDAAPLVADETCLLQLTRGERHALAPHAEHAGKRLLAQREPVVRGSLAREQQPPDEPLLDAVNTLTERSERDLRQKRVRTAEHEMTKVTVLRQLLERGVACHRPDLPTTGTPAPRQDGNVTAGRDVFRFETFGNEGFWTDAVRVPAGVAAAKVTPMMAMKLGVSVDVDALDAETLKALVAELKRDPSGRTSKLLNDPATTVKLINANAVIGMVPKDRNGDGVIDITKGDKAGVTCALCHTITDGSLLNMPHGGSVGHRQDGRTNHDLNVGKLLAAGANSRALYPVLQLSLKANGGKTFGRAPKGLTENSTEAEVDAYLSNPKYYPLGMFDDTPDGNGNTMHIPPFFRQDLAAPFGSGGEIARLDNFNNLVYTALLDQTNLTSPGGRAFLHKLGGAAGDEIADNYVKVLDATGVKGYPFVR